MQTHIQVVYKYGRIGHCAQADGILHLCRNQRDSGYRPRYKMRLMIQV